MPAPAAVVMHSLFEEQPLESQPLDHYFYFTEAFAEALTWFPEKDDYKVGPEEYLEHIRKAKEAVDIPVIGSLNGVSPGGWSSLWAPMQEAGADALELNIYYLPTDPIMDGATVEQIVLDVLRPCCESAIPVAVKLGPYYCASPNLAVRLNEAGADGLVLFNRFYQPDLDLDALEVVPHLVLSTSNELRLPLRWIAILYGRIELDLALTDGRA